MDFAAHVLYQAAINRFWLIIPAAILLTLGVPILSALRASGLVVRVFVFIIIAFLLLAIANVIFGPSIATSAIYHAGEAGTATITGSYATGVIYNNQRVYGFDVLIRTAASGVIQTRFEEDDFNVYPSSNEVDYPGVNDMFSVRYLPGYPKDFVIVTNDDSPWANKLRCNDKYKTLIAARAKYIFDRANAGFRTEYLGEIRSFIAGKCYTDENDLRAYDQDIRNVQKGLPPVPIDGQD